MKFTSMTLAGWRQFGDVSLTFHPRLTILTGANGAGKTTLLNIINRHFGWNLSFVSTPRRKSELQDYFNDYWYGERPIASGPTVASGHQTIGSIAYSNGGTAEIGLPRQVSENYNVDVLGAHTVAGIFVASHRPMFFYQKMETIPTVPTAKDQLFNTYLTEVRNRFSVNSRVTSPSLRLKQALTSLAVFGYGNQAVQANDAFKRTLENFEAVLRIVLPPSLRFEKLSIAIPEVMLETGTGRFSLDAVSGGIASIIDLTWQVYLYSEDRDEFSVVVDEIENHLHPELQQSILPRLLEAFPQVQFIITSHNPLVVTSVPESNVFALRFGSDGKVYSAQLDYSSKAMSADETLREVLGLTTSLPLWSERILRSAIDRFSEEYSDEGLTALHDTLLGLGLERQFADIVAEAIERNDQVS